MRKVPLIIAAIVAAVLLGQVDIRAEDDSATPDKPGVVNGITQHWMHTVIISKTPESFLKEGETAPLLRVQILVECLYQPEKGKARFLYPLLIALDKDKGGAYHTPFGNGSYIAIDSSGEPTFNQPVTITRQDINRKILSSRSVIESYSFRKLGGMERMGTTHTAWVLTSPNPGCIQPERHKEYSSMNWQDLMLQSQKHWMIDWSKDEPIAKIVPEEKTQQGVIVTPGGK